MKHEEKARGLFRSLKAQVDDAAVALSNTIVSHVKFTNNMISIIKDWETTLLYVFIALNKSVVISTINDMTIDQWVLAKRFVTLAKVTAPNKEYYGIASGPFKYKRIKESYDKKVLALSTKLADITERGIQAALSAGAKRVAGVLEVTNTESILLTSGNVDTTEKGTELYFSIRAFADKDASGHDIAVSRVMNKFNIEETAKKSARTAMMAKHPINGDIGKFDVVFAPLPFANILEKVGSAASIFNVEAGLSFFTNALNKRVAAPLVSIYDDGLLENGLHSSKCDAEGVPSKRTAIIEHGVLNSYLHNTSTAKRYGTESTANAGIIAPEPRNIVFQQGKDTPQKLIEQVNNGIYVTNVWYTRAQNLLTGDFSTIPRDGIFYIKRGKVQHAIKNIRISDNMLHILRNLYAIANNKQQIRGWEVETPVTTPSVLVKDLNITRPLEM